MDPPIQVPDPGGPGQTEAHNEQDEEPPSIWNTIGNMLANAMYQAHQAHQTGNIRVRSVVIATGPRARFEQHFPPLPSQLPALPAPDQRSTNTPDPEDPPSPLSELHTFLQTLTMTMQANGFQQMPLMTAQTGGANFQEMFRNMFNPENAVQGDAVFTQEAFDRIMSQMMEANAADAGPGPASNAAIEALPKRAVDAGMMGSDGKAECSVCMDGVVLGEEVTVLPCRHWFHEQCVTIWLKEHNTCPQCRQGISEAQTAPTNTVQPTAEESPPESPSDSPPCTQSATNDSISGPASNTRSRVRPRMSWTTSSSSSSPSSSSRRGVSSWLRNLRERH